MLRPIVGALVVTLLWPTAAASRQPSRQQYRWGDLETRIRGRQIEFVLPDGTEVRGKAIAVEPAGLRMNVTTTSNPASQPKGEHIIPAQSLSILQVRETGKKWRIICTAALPVVILAAIAAANRDLPHPGTSGYKEVAAGFWGTVAGGYLLGWALDRKVAEIVITP